MTSLQTEAGSLISCYESVEKRKIIAYFYEDESNRWHKQIHKNGGSVDQNIQITLNSISGDSKMYVVSVGDELAGFFVRFENNVGVALEGFHVAKRFRTPKFLGRFWDLVKEKLGRSFKTGISSRNEPALNHLLRQGFEVDHKKIIGDQIFFILSLKF